MKRNNTISIIKLLAPIIVIFYHTVSLTNKTETITIISNFIKTHFVGLNIFAVSTIFLISGYLFDSSLEHNKNDKVFWKRKIIRLLIPLAIVVILSIILGAFISSYTISEYLLSKTTHEYLLNIIFMPRYNLPGVFVNNPYPNAVNGSLWTMPLTIICYLSCFVIYKLKPINKRLLMIVLCLIAGLLTSIYVGNNFLKNALYPTTSFYIGVIYSRYRNKIKYNIRLLLLCIFLIIVLIITKKSIYVFYVIYPYILFFIINKLNNNITIIKKDFSYEMYLCAFPIQQFLVYYSNNNMSQIMRFLLSVVLSMTIGVIIRKISVLLIESGSNKHEGICYRS